MRVVNSVEQPKKSDKSCKNKNFSLKISLDSTQTKTNKTGGRQSPGKADRIKEAISEVGNGSSLRSTAKKFGFSASFLRRRVKGEVEIDSRNGPRPVFTCKEESELAKWFSKKFENGTVPRPGEFLDFVQEVVKKGKKKTAFKIGRPSYDWYRKFMARNAHLIEEYKPPLEHKDASSFLNESDENSHLCSVKKYKRGYRTSLEKLKRIRKAMNEVKNGNSGRKTAKKYGLSASFLMRRVNGEVEIDSRNGPSPIFTCDEERELAKWFTDKGKGNGPTEFLDFVQGIIKKEKKKTVFTNGRPSHSWYYSFIARNAHLFEKRQEPSVEKNGASTLDSKQAEYQTYSVTAYHSCKVPKTSIAASPLSCKVPKSKTSTSTVTSLHSCKVPKSKTPTSSITTFHSCKVPNFKKGYLKSPEKVSRVRQAVSEVRNGNSIRKTAKKFGISHSFLGRRVNGEVEIDSRNGPSPIFTIEEESVLAKWVSDTSERTNRQLGPAEFLEPRTGNYKKRKKKNFIYK